MIVVSVDVKHLERRRRRRVCCLSLIIHDCGFCGPDVGGYFVAYVIICSTDPVSARTKLYGGRTRFVVLFVKVFTVMTVWVPC